MRTLDVVAAVLLIVGGLNWGLVAIDPSYDLVAAIGGSQAAPFSKLVYALVGLAAVYSLIGLPAFRRRWGSRRLQPA